MQMDVTYRRQFFYSHLNRYSLQCVHDGYQVVLSGLCELLTSSSTTHMYMYSGQCIKHSSQ